jgi:hypothetical protein
MTSGGDARLHSPAAERNRQPILERLRRWLPQRGTALEIASGTGQHAAWFAAGLPGWKWQPSDPDPTALASIAAWRSTLLPGAREAPAGLLAPLHLDVMARPWPIDTPVDAVFCANLLHIAPWVACAALFHGAADHVAAEGRLILYGPYLIDGVTTAPGNRAFDDDLRARNPAWGLRRLSDLLAVAAGAGWVLRERDAMPANNTMLMFGRAQST